MLSLLDMVIKGGIMMIPIFICSVIAIAIIIERWIVIRRTRKSSHLIVLQVKNILSSGTVEQAIGHCEQSKDMTARLLIEGLRRWHESKQEIVEALENAGREELYNLERHIPTLATIAGLAPLFGFLGTVTGMVRAFMVVQQLGGNVNASVLAGGIWEALVTTVAGLVVGIPALVYYNHFVSKIQQIAFELSRISFELVEFITRDSGKKRKTDGDKV